MGAPDDGRGGAGWRRTAVVWLFVALCASLGWSGMMLVFGTAHPLQVTSGHSMLPTLRTGDVAIIQSVAPWDLHVGEIVAVHVPRADQTTYHSYHYPPEIVHRISALDLQGSGLIVQTKGDSQGPDPFTVPATDVTGRMVLAVPFVGYGFLFVRSRPGHIAVIGLLVLALAYWAIGALFGTSEGGGRPVTLGGETEELALAIREYGEHLRSHTRVVRELGDTTVALRQAAVSQNDILDWYGRRWEGCLRSGRWSR